MFDVVIDCLVQEIILFGVLSYVDIYVSLCIDYKFSECLLVQVGISVICSDFCGLDCCDDLFVGSFGLSYCVYCYWQVEVSYQLLQCYLDVFEVEYYCNEIYFGVCMDGSGCVIVCEVGLLFVVIDWLLVVDGFYVGVSIGYGNVDMWVIGLCGEYGIYCGDFVGSGLMNFVFVGYGQMLGCWYLGLEVVVGCSQVDWLYDKMFSSCVFFIDQECSEEFFLCVGLMLLGNNLLFVSVGCICLCFDSVYIVEDGICFVQFDCCWFNVYGIGLDVLLSCYLFVCSQYDFVCYCGYDVVNVEVSDCFVDSIGWFQLGLGWCFGVVFELVCVIVDISGFYVGVQGGDNCFGSWFDVIQCQLEVLLVINFYIDFGGYGINFGVFGGYGYVFGLFYVGVELESDGSGSDWYYDKQFGGCQFLVEGWGSYGVLL